MESYSAFAYVYDQLMEDVDYKGWVLYIEEIFERCGIKPKNIAELACGTGNVTNILAKRGYNLIGVDISADMLFIAQEKSRAMGVEVIYLNHDMRELSLPTELDGILCVCDGVNYIADEKDLRKVFKSVYHHLKDGGLFIFDISTYYKLANILGNNTYAENFEEVSYIWENYFEEAQKMCDFDLTIFVKEEDTYRKYEETHSQRAYEEKEILDQLKGIGFKKIECFEAFTFSDPKEESERIYFVCQK
ncbi:class I SAM-dependent DNA methyltransferase [Marinisporobacter balticus]|uniref:Ubiquinone/menaquinone biosynthesis C-methylase UbiE n=1 Tax=Marinisporobacter balticus TaxID=2018667 RepID=A0A4R2KD95_9FIRM|nr:class I SAM-dependent methyltransferase [Marinisporobacter balticus]TCO71473.1 ubiquinone/menaquinone biosynthesis C-methylase UbiE [Marinisporobacter balticus]